MTDVDEIAGFKAQCATDPKLRHEVLELPDDAGTAELFYSLDVEAGETADNIFVEIHRVFSSPFSRGLAEDAAVEFVVKKIRWAKARVLPFPVVHIGAMQQMDDRLSRKLKKAVEKLVSGPSARFRLPRTDAYLPTVPEAS